MIDIRFSTRHNDGMKSKFNNSPSSAYDAALAAARAGDVRAFENIRALTPLDELQRAEIFIAAMHAGAHDIARISVEDCRKLGFIEREHYSTHLWHEIIAAGKTDFADIMLGAGLLPMNDACFSLMGEKGDMAMMRLVREKHTRINHNSTAALLRSAAENGHHDCVDYVLDAFQVHLKNYILVSVMKAALDRAQDDIALKIAHVACTRIKKGAIRDIDEGHISKVLTAVVRSERSGILPHLLPYHPAPLETLIRHAAVKSDTQALEFLLDEAVRRQEPVIDYIHRSPLLAAVNIGAIDALRVFCQKGLDMTVCDNVPVQVALFHARSNRKSGADMLLLLAGAGADTDFIIENLKKDHTGDDALIAAILDKGKTCRRKALARLEMAMTDSADLASPHEALGASPVVFAARCNIMNDFIKRIDKNRLTAALFLSDEGAVLNILAQRQRLKDLLDPVVWAGRREQAQHLLTACAQRDIKDSCLDMQAFTSALDRETLMRRRSGFQFRL